MTSGARHVIFGTGAIGLATCAALRSRGETVRMVNRSGTAAVPDGVDVVGGDASEPAFTTDVAAGAAVVYQTLNPPYARWVEDFPALQAGAYGYILKEQPREAIAEQLQRIASGEPPLSPSIARKVIAYFAAQAKPPQHAMPHVQLTERESEVLLRVAKGFTLPEIGVQLNLSRHTIADYVKQIYRKLNVSSRAEAALEAQRLGLFGRGRRAQEHTV